MAKRTLVKKYIINTNEVRYYQGGTHTHEYISTGEVPSVLSEAKHFSRKSQAVKYLETILPEEEQVGTYTIEECYIFIEAEQKNKQENKGLTHE